MSDLEGGHQDIVNSIQRLEYDLDFEDVETVVKARELLIHTAFLNIAAPIRVTDMFHV